MRAAACESSISILAGVIEYESPSILFQVDDLIGKSLSLSHTHTHIYIHSVIPNNSVDHWFKVTAATGYLRGLPCAKLTVEVE